MNILVVTGRLAESIVRRKVKNKAEVAVLDIEVAAFITPSLLRGNIHKNYDLILLPGLVSGDFSALEDELHIPIRLGPKHAADLDFVLSFAEEVIFSRDIPACELLKQKKRKDAFERISELEHKSRASFTLKHLKIGGDSRMKVMAEIVDAGHMDKQALINKIRYFEYIGADIIDLGLSLDTTPQETKLAVEAAVSATQLPISIDTTDPDLINVALNLGIDMVLSLNSENMREVNIKHAAVVVIPDQNDIDSLFQNIELARNAGITKIIADPVLEPVGKLVDSISRYYEFRKQDRAMPLFFGAGNVTELIDADSIGINALLAGIAMELDANILFTPDFSHKTYNGVSELKTASMMMMLAKHRETPPKDLGVDLLVVKEKRRRGFGILSGNYIQAKSDEEWHLDPAGCFKIEITPEEIQNENYIPAKIIAENKKNNTLVAGTTAKQVMDTILRLGLVSRLDHAAYLGRELMKAELALRFKRSYSQDDEF